MIRLATTSDIPRLLELLHQVTVTAMQKAERGCATYTTYNSVVKSPGLAVFVNSTLQNEEILHFFQ